MKLSLPVVLASLLSAVGQENPPAGPLSPETAARTFTTFDDLEVEQVLAEPVVRQPVFITFDERGRLWVIQYIQYPAPAGLTLLSKDQFWRAVYDKIPEPPPNHVRGEDKITVHEDSDGDGKYDTHKTFVDGLNIATACAFGNGGVWVLNPPYLLFYPDRNKDDVPDSAPEVHLSGFGLEDTHSVVNSLRFGPDGWLYAAQGSTVSAEVIRPGLDKEPFRTMGQLIWRYHPETKIYEVFAEGGGNAFGLEMDDKARIFSGHNGGDTRGFHYVQGGYLQKGFEKHGPLSNPYAFGYFRQMPHNKVERFTHNFIIYGGGTLPEKYWGRLFGVEPLQGRVVMSEISPLGSSYQTKDIAHAITTTDRYFKPVDIKVGPDGAIYVADWYDRQVAHTRNYEGLIDKSNGRIYRLKGRDASPLKPFNLNLVPTLELVKTLSHSNRWFRQTAVRLLAERKDLTAVPPLVKQLHENTGQLALESLWGIYVSGGFNENTAADFLAHKDPHVRSWTVRFLGDARQLTGSLQRKLATLARDEPHLEVRSQLASTAKRLPGSQALPIISELMARSEDSSDVYIPLLIWWALESKAASDRDGVLALFEPPSVWNLPIVSKDIAPRLMRRYAMAGTRQDLLTCAKLLATAPEDEHKKSLVAALEEGTRGRSLANWPLELQEEVANSGGDTLPLDLRRGKPEAIAQALLELGNSQAGNDRKIRLVQILGEQPVTNALATLLDLALDQKNAALQKAALHSLQVYDSPQIPQQLLTRLNDFPAESRMSAMNLLVARSSFAEKLMNAVEQEQFSFTQVPAEIAQKIKTLSAPLKGRAEKFWPSSMVSSESLKAKIKSFTQTINSGSGDPFTGQKNYQMLCGSCHKLFGEGGLIGPDLTPFKRDDLETMLAQILDPSGEIREGYENILIETRDGRAVSGFLADKDNTVYVVRGLDGENTIVRKNEVKEFKSAGASLMPEGLLEALDEQQVRDLFAYLRSAQPLVKR